MSKSNGGGNSDLFWATGINNKGLKSDAQATRKIFTDLAVGVNRELDKITKKFANLLNADSKNMKSNVVQTISTQMKELSNVIEREKAQMTTMAGSYGDAMKRINFAAKNIGKGVVVQSPLTKVVANIHKQVEQANNDMTFMKKRFMFAIGSMVAYGSINTLKSLFQQIIQVKGTFDQLAVSIDSFTGSAEKGKKVMQELTSLAVKSPFQLIDITDSAKQLLAYGETAENVTETIRKMSDVSAGSGQSIRDISYLYGTSLTQGRLYARDLFQFANRGVPIYKALAATMRDTNGEMGISTAKLKTLVTAGKVGFDQLKSAVDYLTSAGGIYYGLSDKLAETTYGKISNLKDKWTMALKEMGESTSGIMNAGVSVVTTAIEHWDSLAKAILTAASAVGTYQVARLAMNVMVTGGNEIRNAAETKSLLALIEAEGEEVESKRLVKFAADKETQSLRLQAKQLLANAQLAHSTAVSELKDITEKIELNAADIAAQKRSIAITQEQIANKSTLTATRKLENQQLKLEALNNEANNLAKQKGVAVTAVSSTAKKEETITAGIHAAAITADTAAVDFLAIAKARLIKVTKSLKYTLIANPYTALFVAVTTLAAAILILRDRTTAQERAEKKLDETMSKVNKTIDERKRKVSDLMNTVLNENEAEATRIEALNTLKELYPQRLKDLNLENISRQKSLEITKSINEEISKGRLSELEKAKDNAKEEYETKHKEWVEALKYEEYMSKNPLLIYKVKSPKLGEEVKEAKILYNELNEKYQKALDASQEAKKKKDKEVVTENKEFWTKQKQDAEAVLNDIDVKYKKLFGKKNSAELIPEKVFTQLTNATSKLKEAKTNLAFYNEDKDKVTSKTDTTQNITALKESIESNNAKLTKAEVDANLKKNQAIVDSMDEGYLKKQEQQKINYAKELAAVKEHAQKLLKIEQENAIDKYKLEHKDWKKGDLPHVTELSASSQSIVDTETATAEQRNATAEAKILKDRLKEFRDFTTQKVELLKTYQDNVKAFEVDRAKALKEGDTELVSQIDSAIKQSEVKYKEDVSKIDFTELQKKINWGDAFSNLDKLSVASLNDLLSQLTKFKDNANDELSKVDMSTLSKGIESMQTNIMGRDPFAALKKSMKEYAAATKKVNAAKDKYDRINRGEIVTTTKVNEETGETITKVVTATEAYEDLKDAQDDQVSAGDNVEQSAKKSKKEIDKLITAVQGVGQSAGGTVGEVIGIITSISSFTIGIALAIKATSSMAAGAIKSMEKASIILAIISTALEVTMAIISLFDRTPKSLKSYNKLKEETEAYTEALDDAIEKEKEMLDVMSGSSAVESAKKTIQMLKKEIEAFQKTAVAAAKARDKHEHSRGYKTNKKLKSYWDDISYTAGMDIDSIYDFFTLSPEQLANIKKNQTYAWSLIDDDIKEQLEKIIEAGDNIDEVIADSKEKLTGLSFDDASSSLDDFLTDVDSTIDDIADDFQDKMNQAMLGLVKDEYLNKALSGWYDDLVEDMGKDSEGGEHLTDDEISALQDSYTNIYQNAKDRLAAMQRASGIDMGESGNDTESAIQSMTQESATILTAQFTALRIHGASIDTISQEISNKLDNFLVSLQSRDVDLDLMANDISAIKNNTDRLEKIENILSNMNNNGVKMK